MAIIISVINWKGGVGKTTLTHHLGTGLTHRRKRVLLLDLDPQCNLSCLTTGSEKYYRKMQEGNTPTIKNLFEGFLQRVPILAEEVILKKSVNSSRGNVYNYVDVVLSHEELTELDLKLARYQPAASSIGHVEATQTEVDRLSVIKNMLDQIKDDYDYIFIDCPPNVHPVTQNALFASNFYLIPAMPDFLSSVGITRIRNKITKLDQKFKSLCDYVEQPYHSIQCAGIIFNKVSEYAGASVRAHQHYMNAIREEEAALVFDSYIVEGNGIADAAERAHPVYAYANHRTATKAHRQIECLNQIMNEFLHRVHR